jgi:hypothetical protein
MESYVASHDPPSQPHHLNHIIGTKHNFPQGFSHCQNNHLWPSRPLYQGDSCSTLVKEEMGESSPTLEWG